VTSGKSFVPDQGDVVWLNFNPQAGYEQAGRRPALVLSPAKYNEKVGLAIFCSITNQEKGYPFEVKIPDDLKVSGVILADHVKNLDWRIRQTAFICKMPRPKTAEVLQKLTTLLKLSNPD
jgi:mRNA interferase MazF